MTSVPPAPGAAPLRVEEVDSIARVDRAAWDALAPDVGASHGWIRTVEQTFLGNIRPRHVLVREGDRLVAAVEGRVMERHPDILHVDNRLWGRLAKVAPQLGLSFLPALISGPQNAYGQHFLLEPGASPERRTALRATLLAEVERAARAAGLPVFLTNVLEDEAEAFPELRARGYHPVEIAPLTFLDIEWPDFEGYKRHIRALSHGAFNAIKTEMNRNRREGVTIESIEDPAPHQARLHALYDGHYRRLNGVPFPFRPEFFVRLKENLGAEVRIYGSFKGGVLTGSSVVLQRGGVGWVMATGIDRALVAKDFSYFNLVYYRPIADAAAAGLKRLYFGIAAYEAKARRGCRIQKVFHYYRSSNPLRNLAAGPGMAFFSWWHRDRVPDER